MLTLLTKCQMQNGKWQTLHICCQSAVNHNLSSQLNCQSQLACSTQLPITDDLSSLLLTANLPIWAILSFTAADARIRSCLPRPRARGPSPAPSPGRPPLAPAVWWTCPRPAVQCSAVPCSVVQCRAMQCSAVQSSAVQCRAVQCSAVQCSAVQCSAV